MAKSKKRCDAGIPKKAEREAIREFDGVEGTLAAARGKAPRTTVATGHVGHQAVARGGWLHMQPVAANLVAVHDPARAGGA